MFEFETVPDGAETTVKSGKYGPYSQVKREVKTRWVLNPEAEGVPKVVVDLVTSHWGERKQFSTTLTWGTVKQVQKHPADGPGVLAIETWGSDHMMVRVHSTPVARYSVKAMEAHHEAAMAVVEEQWEGAKRVFEQAVEANGLAEVEV